MGQRSSVAQRMTYPSIPQERDKIIASKRNQFHYEVSRGDIASGICLVRKGEIPELVIVTSQIAEDTLDSNVLLTIFYSIFTTLLRDLYDSVERPWYPLYRRSGYSDGVGVVEILSHRLSYWENITI